MPFTRFFSYFFPKPKALIIGFSGDSGLLQIQYNKEQQGYKCYVVYVGEDGTLKIPHLEITTNDIVIIAGHGRWGTDRITASSNSKNDNFITASAIGKAIHPCLSTANPPEPLIVEARCCHSAAGNIPYSEQWLEHENSFIGILYANFQALNIKTRITGYLFGVNAEAFLHKKETGNIEEYPIISYIEKSESENILYCAQYYNKFCEAIEEVYKNSRYDIFEPANLTELEFHVCIPMIAAEGSTVILTTPGLPLPPSLQFIWREQNDVVISYPFGYPIMDAPEYLLRRKEELPNRSAFIFPDQPDITAPIVYSNEKQKKRRKEVLEKYAIVRMEITAKYAEIVCDLKAKYTDSLGQDFNNKQFKKIENYLINWNLENYLEYWKPGVNFLLSDPAITAQCLRYYIQNNLESDQYSNPPLMKMFFHELIEIIQYYNGYYLERYLELGIGHYCNKKANEAYLYDLERLAFFHGNLYCRLPPTAGPDTLGEKSKEKTALTASGSAIRPT